MKKQHRFTFDIVVQDNRSHYVDITEPIVNFLKKAILTLSFNTFSIEKVKFIRNVTEEYGLNEDGSLKDFLEHGEDLSN